MPKNIYEFNNTGKRLLKVTIPNDPDTGALRSVECNAFIVSEDFVKVKTTVYNVDNLGNKLNKKRYPPFVVDLEYFKDYRGAFVNKDTGVYVTPDNNNEVPNSTITKCEYITDMLKVSTNINDVITSLILENESLLKFNV